MDPAPVTAALADQKRQLLSLFLLSFSALLLEVLFIRWIGTEIQLFSYLKNLVLMACFLGLGAGCATPIKQTQKFKPELVFPILLSVLVVIISTSGLTDLAHVNLLIDNDVYDFSVGIGSAGRLLVNLLCLCGMFILIMATFDQFGRLLGKEFAGLPPLKSYTINLLGSLLGVLAFCIASYLHLSPPFWLLAALLPLIPVYLQNKNKLIILSLTTLLCVSAAWFSTASALWSPYSRIETQPILEYHKDAFLKPVSYPVGTAIVVNHGQHQHTIDLSESFLKDHPEIKESNEFRAYELPYAAVPHPNEVLILGAGTGNDVSAAVRHGAKHVDAVEIDPVIAALGHTVHPEKPYDSPTVTLIQDDARAFLSRSNKKYDLIALGQLDSGTALSTMVSVRLDNYLYTKEALASIAEHLTPDGIVSISFATQPEWLRARFFQLAKTMGSTEPLAFNTQHGAPRTILVMTGPGLDAVRKELEKNYSHIIANEPELMMPVELSTDEWPFIYQRARTVPMVSLIVLALVLSISVIVVHSRFRMRKGSFKANLQFFLLGAGFLLMETRGMLAVALLFASTWMVNSTIIALVLVMALLANLLASKTKFPTQGQAYILLLIALLILFLLPLATLATLSLPLKILGTALLLGLPFLFSGVIFARAFSKTKEPEVAIGINILGAIVGGCLEYLSLVVGTNGLIPLAMLTYILSWLAATRSSKQNY